MTDDEKNVVELIGFLLQKDGYDVVTAFDGKACLDKVQSEKPDLIILDIMMPIMDGYTVFTKLAENDETRKIPIIILTAKGQMKDMFAMSSNIAAYMDKPFDPMEIRSKVREILDSRKKK
ncbi:MAG TPA: response regulator [Elusimicrobiota bacterium]|nr:response regulator [Elusimicrobiota bacterium]